MTVLELVTVALRFLLDLVWRLLEICRVDQNHVIAVIGDGAITGGMAYEAMNNAGYLDTNMIIILNDNQQVSISYLAISSHVFS